MFKNLKDIVEDKLIYVVRLFSFPFKSQIMKKDKKNSQFRCQAIVCKGFFSGRTFCSLNVEMSDNLALSQFNANSYYKMKHYT